MEQKKNKLYIYINFEFEDYYNLYNHIEFNRHIENKIVSNKKHYLFFDEIQKVEKWELAVNFF